MVTSFYHNNDVTDRRATSVWPTCGCSWADTGMWDYYGPIRVCGIIRIHHNSEGGIEKSVLRIKDWYHEA